MNSSNFSGDFSGENIKENEGFRKADTIINALFSGVNPDEMKESIALLKSWKSIVGTISSNPVEKNRTGQLLASHSDVVDLKNGILLVETDHPGYIQMLQMYKDYILRGLKKNFPELNIRLLSFRLKGSDAKLNNGLELSEQEKLEQQRLAEAKQKDSNVKLTVDTNLPTDLQKAFEKIKNALD